MSDFGDMSFDDMRDISVPVSDLVDHLNIDDYFEYYPDEVEQAWDLAPTGDMSEGQLEHFVDMLIDLAEELDFDDWQEMLDYMDADFWEWYHENYE